MTEEQKAPVQGAAHIPWSVHVRAWNAYAAKYSKDQSAERIAERGGFDVADYIPRLGAELLELVQKLDREQV